MLFYFSDDLVIHTHTHMASQVAQLVKNLPANAGDAKMWVLTPGSGRSPKVENGKPLQYSYLENSMDRGRSLVGYSPWGHKELNTGKAHTDTHINIYIYIYIIYHILSIMIYSRY